MIPNTRPNHVVHCRPGGTIVTWPTGRRTCLNPWPGAKVLCLHNGSALRTNRHIRRHGEPDLNRSFVTAGPPLRGRPFTRLPATFNLLCTAYLIRRARSVGSRRCRQPRRRYRYAVPSKLRPGPPAPPAVPLPGPVAVPPPRVDFWPSTPLIVPPQGDRNFRQRINSLHFRSLYISKNNIICSFVWFFFSVVFLLIFREKLYFFFF